MLARKYRGLVQCSLGRKTKVCQARKFPKSDYLDQYHMRVFVTVGSTRFDALVNSVLSFPVLSGLRLKGYRNVVIQCGNSEFHSLNQAKDLLEKSAMDVEIWQFKPSLEEEYQRADLIISHAGPPAEDTVYT